MLPPFQGAPCEPRAPPPSVVRAGASHSLPQSIGGHGSNRWSARLLNTGGARTAPNSGGAAPFPYRPASHQQVFNPALEPSPLPPACLLTPCRLPTRVPCFLTASDPRYHTCQGCYLAQLPGSRRPSAATPPICARALRYRLCGLACPTPKPPSQRGEATERPELGKLLGKLGVKLPARATSPVPPDLSQPVCLLQIV